MIRRFVTLLLLAVVLTTSGASAATDEFTIRQQVGSDTTPPSVPLGVSTTPVSSSQIDITWGTSTDDNVGLGGYQVFRDGLAIATTGAAVTSYNDIGLAPTTTYVYGVKAFDLFLNYSALSATSATTTLAPPIPVRVPNGMIEMEPIVLTIDGVETIVKDTSAVISFTTPGYAIASVRYGRTPQYEAGSLASGLYELSHSFTLSELEPEVRYFFELTAQNQRGDEVRYTGQFVTKTLVDIVPPANVRSLTAAREGSDVLLSWQNPPENDFRFVRIIGNQRFYPLDVNDGALLYEGSAESFRHSDVFPRESQMYYTVFAFDENGNQSSGALVGILAERGQPDFNFDRPGAPEDDTPFFDDDVAPEQSDGVSTPAVRQPGSSLTFGDLEFIQNERIRQGFQAVVNLDPNANFTVRIPYELVPENLKTITVTLFDPEDPDQRFTFLLRINERKTHYEATIGTLGREAAFPLRFSMLDYGTTVVSSFTGTISTIPKTEQAYPVASRTFLEQLIFVFTRWWWWLIILVLLTIAYYLMKD